jgi:hypothetical protein
VLIRMTAPPSQTYIVATEAEKGGNTVRVLLAICAVVLMAPVLLVIGIALGPAALVMLFIAGCTAIVLSLVGMVSRHSRDGRVPPFHQ